MWEKPPRAQSTSMLEACGRSGSDTTIECCPQVDSSDDSGHGRDDLMDIPERDLTVVAPKRRVRRVFNDDEAPVQLSRGRFQALSSGDGVEHSEKLLPTQQESPVEEPPSECVPVAAHRVVDGGPVAEVVSKGLKRLRIVQNNAENVPPALPPPPLDEVPIRSESSDALSDGSIADTVMSEEDSEAGAEEFQ